MATGGFLPFANPISNWVAPRRNQLMGFASGMLSGDPGDAFKGSMQGSVLDMAAADRDQQKAQLEEQTNATRAWLEQEGFTDLVPLVDAGQGAAAFEEALRRKQPGYGQGEAFTLAPGETRYGSGGQVIAQGAPDTKDQFNNEKDLAAQYGQQDPVKTYQGVRNNYERIRSSATANSGPGDISMIFAYMKMLDPTSVVREGEFATAENAGGVGAYVSNIYNRLLSGERLTPDLRKQFLSSADQFYNDTASNLTSLNDQYSNRAGAWGVDPSRFMVTPESYPSLSGIKNKYGLE